MLLDYILGSMANVISKLFVNSSWRVWIIFRMNFELFFWRYMLSLYLHLHILPSNVFPKKPSIWFVIMVADHRIISPRPRHSEEVFSMVAGLLFSFPNKFAQDLVDRAGELSLVLIYDICNVYDWLYSQYCGRVKMVDMAPKFLGNIEDWRLLVRVIWFCETAKLSKFVLSNFQRMT